MKAQKKPNPPKRTQSGNRPKRSMSIEQDGKKCLEKLTRATQALELPIPQTQLAKIAKLIVQTMTGPWRYFHSPEHVFAVGDSDDPLEVLAALFHDIVYVQVDGSINFNLTYYISAFIEEERGQLKLRSREDLPADRTFEMVAAIFNFSPGQGLSPYSGQNEFLSAVVATKVLEPFASPSILAQIAACIEATVPFRPKTELGVSASEILYQRLHLVREQFALSLSEEDLVETIKKAVRMSNRDVAGFAHTSSAVFLNNTWNLLPETNHNLQKSGSYTVRDYRTAIQKMAGFLSFLKPEVIFEQFRGEPDARTYNSLVDRARRNLEVGRLYLESKLVAISILEALSMRIGQEVSLAIMVGELPDSEISIGRLTDYLPNILNPRQPADEIEVETMQLLEVGRSEGSDYDLKNSPLAAFIVRYIGFERVRQLQHPLQVFFGGAMSSEEFLESCDRHVVDMIASEVVKMLENRKTALSWPRSQSETPSPFLRLVQ
ncbi:MAG: hypothetical protein SW833_20810 [Cyanobacteriota bacterium]|nr:hypothetical protein [Cyanobacteriota bacterium]